MPRVPERLRIKDDEDSPIHSQPRILPKLNNRWLAIKTRRVLLKPQKPGTSILLPFHILLYSFHSFYPFSLCVCVDGILYVTPSFSRTKTS